MKTIWCLSLLTSFASIADAVKLRTPTVGGSGKKALTNSVGISDPVHVTMEMLHLQPQDVYVLPKVTDVIGCLSALQGPPLFHFPKPYDSGIETIDVNAYEVSSQAAAHVEDSEGAAAKGNPEVVHHQGLPAVSVAKYKSHPPEATEELMSARPKSDTKSPEHSVADAEYLPPQYASLSYLIYQAILFAILLPCASWFLDRGKFYPYHMLTVMSAAFGIFFALIIGINAFSLSWWITIPLSLVFGGLVGLIALRPSSIIPWAYLFGITTEPLGWICMCKLFALLVANFGYQLLSALSPFTLGLAGLVTESINVATAIYFSWLAIFATVVFVSLRSKALPPASAQNLVVSFTAGYVFTAGVAFFFNLAIIWGRVDAFLVALDPVSFFTVVTIFKLNVFTVFILLFFAIAFTGGLLRHQQRDVMRQHRQAKDLRSTTTDSLSESSQVLSSLE